MSRKTLKVIRPGSFVTLPGGKAAGTVLEACVGPGGAVSYQVAWWDGCDRITARLEAWEVEPAQGAEFVALGFCPKS